MWLITNFGFFSVVEKPEDKGTDQLTVRARVKADLEALRERHLPDLGAIKVNAGSDYRYRARVSREELAHAAAQIVRDIAYGNFKNSVAKEQGYAREKIYHGVWNALYQLQDDEITYAAPVHEPAEDSPSGSLEKSYGGVIFDEQGRVLLRKPKKEFDGYVWTFSKGRADPGASPEETALREVQEETGYDCLVLAEIPGWFPGGTTTNKYFLMQPAGDPKRFGWETEEIRWVVADEARAAISQTRNRTGRERDLAVLEAALSLRRTIQGD